MARNDLYCIQPRGCLLRRLCCLRRKCLCDVWAVCATGIGCKHLLRDARWTIYGASERKGEGQRHDVPRLIRFRWRPHLQQKVYSQWTTFIASPVVIERGYGYGAYGYGSAVLLDLDLRVKPDFRLILAVTSCQSQNIGKKYQSRQTPR